MRLLGALLSDEVVYLLIVSDTACGIVQSTCSCNHHSGLLESAAHFGLGDEVISGLGRAENLALLEILPAI